MCYGSQRFPPSDDEITPPTAVRARPPADVNTAVVETLRLRLAETEARLQRARAREAELSKKLFEMKRFVSVMEILETYLKQRFIDQQHQLSLLISQSAPRNLVVVSSPDLAKEVLHTQGVEFGSRTRNVVFDIFTGKGQDMVFTVYGEHWRKMRRIMTVPFFTNKVVQQYRFGWEAEAAAVVEDVRNNPAADMDWRLEISDMDLRTSYLLST
ncbi:hypothetical protein OSB04_006874 [Centaurea solstitialis]|uniref:Uncharacterized protein n=1 Tax=Centaurea solstitialis TaxID=347529 RepID=A0AA38TKJ4_9ASTR|nr:hypothetical protein OSB04_006874 [Centaurea solstitialis]